MATISDTIGNSYYVLPYTNNDSVKTLTEAIGFTTLQNDLSDGYISRRLLGSDTGVREWTLKLPTLAALSVLPNTMTDVNGAVVSRQEALWNLYCENQVNGTLFAIQSPRNNQYYLATFEDTQLTYEKTFQVQLYSTGVKLRQVRVPGVTLFDMGQISVASTFHWYNDTSHGATTWNDKAVSGGVNFTKVGDVVFSANPQNGHNTVRLSGTTLTGGLSHGTAHDVTDAIIVLKVREATFSAVESILYPNVSSAPLQPLLQGNNGVATMTGGLPTAWVNGVAQASVGAIAGPMNKFEVVVLSSGGTGFSYQALYQPPTEVGWGLGYRPFTGSNFAKIDVAELVLSPTPIPRNEAREIVQHLVIKWGIL